MDGRALLLDDTRSLEDSVDGLHLTFDLLHRTLDRAEIRLALRVSGVLADHERARDAEGGTEIEVGRGILGSQTARMSSPTRRKASMPAGVDERLKTKIPNCASRFSRASASSSMAPSSV